MPPRGDAVEQDRARELLELARAARWAFPSSSGRPSERPPHPSVERLAACRPELGHAVRAFLDAGQVGAALELAACSWRLWILARDVAGGRAFLAGALAAAPPTPSRWRALALYGDGLLAFWQNALRESAARSEAALADARALGDAEARTLAAVGRSRAALSEGDPERALALAAEAREAARTLAPAFDQSPLHMCAQAHRAAGRLDAAAGLFAASLELNRRLGDTGMVGVELHNLGHVEVRRGQVDLAERLFRECAGDGAADDFGAAMNELNAAAVAVARGETDRAATLLARAEAGLAKAGVDPAGDDQDEIRWIRSQLARLRGA